MTIFGIFAAGAVDLTVGLGMVIIVGAVIYLAVGFAMKNAKRKDDNDRDK